MRPSFIFFLILLFNLGCKNPGNNNKTIERHDDTPVKKENEIQQYENSTWNFSLDYPLEFQVSEGKLPGDKSLINIYLKKTEISKNLTIHEESELPYIAFFPEGIGVDSPSGEQKSLEDYNTDLNLSFNIDEKESRVYLLENGQAWAYYLKFNQAPDKWDKFGGIFVHYQITDFRAACISSTGETLPMDLCDPMEKDEIKFSGNIESENKKKLDLIMESLYFFREDAKERKKLSDLIQVEKPLPNKVVRSPLEISGEARGHWFFEAEAPVELVDKDHEVIAKTSIKAAGQWMTNEYVSFSGELIFHNAPDGESGYLLFEKSNASGKPEMDRKLRVPILFPPK